MSNSLNNECLNLAKEAIDAIQSGKAGCVTLAIRKLQFCAQLLEDKKLNKWCHFHLGRYVHDFPLYDENDNYVGRLQEAIKKSGVELTNEELHPRISKSGGGFESIEYIEQVKERLNKEKRGNDGTYYRNNVQQLVSSVSNAAYLKAAKLYKTMSFGEIPSRQFNFIRDRVDSLLLDICPEAVEKFMVAYERLSSQSAENWSQALTATRRVIKAVADSVYPPRETGKGKRKLGEEQYINRLWAFLDENAEAGSDKDLAKVHVDYLGAFIQKLNDKASKGVHADVTHNEAVRAVLYTYLTLGDILEITGKAVRSIKESRGKVDINSATKDKIMSIKGMDNSLANEIIKRRASAPFKNIDELSGIKGIGPKKLETIKLNFYC